MEKKDIIVLNKRKINLATGEVINLENDSRVGTIKWKKRAVLATLYAHKNQLLTRDQIHEYAGIEENNDKQQIDKIISGLRMTIGEYENSPDKIVSEDSMGYRLICDEQSHKANLKAKSKYVPLDGLKECVEILPDARYVAMSFHMGLKLLSNPTSKTYFVKLLASGYRFKILINSLKAIVTDPEKGKDIYLKEWANFSAAYKGLITIRVSDSPFYRRTYILRENENEKSGVANYRNYNYIENYDVSNTTTHTVKDSEAEYAETCAEFENLWNHAIPFDRYQLKLLTEGRSFAERLMDAFTERENDNLKTYLDDIRDLAEEGYAKAADLIGTHYLKGEAGLEVDCEQALYYIRKAAEGNYPAAIFNLGLVHWIGYGVEQDYKEAVSYFHRAADAGKPDGDACYFLYRAYLYGLGMDKDLAKAQEYRYKAEKLGVRSENYYGLDALQKKLKEKNR